MTRNQTQRRSTFVLAALAAASALALLGGCGATNSAAVTTHTSAVPSEAISTATTATATEPASPTVVVASRTTTGDAPASSTPLGLRAPAGVRAGVAMPSPDRTPGAARTMTTAEVCALPAAPDLDHGLQTQAYQAYGIAPQAVGVYQVDRLIPASLGGSDELANLWPQPAAPAPGYREKDQLEVVLRDLVCNGALGLDDARQEIARDWYSSYQARVVGASTPRLPGTR